MTAGEHWITVIPEAPDRDLDYELECGGVTFACEAWQECGVCRPTEDEEDTGEYERHGEYHRLIDGTFMTSTGRCVIQVCDAGGSAMDLLANLPDPVALAGGRFPIDVDECEEGTVYISFSQEPAR